MAESHFFSGSLPSSSLLGPRLSSPTIQTTMMDKDAEAGIKRNGGLTGTTEGTAQADGPKAHPQGSRDSLSSPQTQSATEFKYYTTFLEDDYTTHFPFVSQLALR